MILHFLKGGHFYAYESYLKLPNSSIFFQVDDHCFDFLKMAGLSAGELENCTWSLYHRWLLLISSLQTKSSWDTADIFKNNDLVFTGYTSSFLSHCDIVVYSMPETIAHRIIRSKHLVASKHLEVSYLCWIKQFLRQIKNFKL